MIKGIIKGPIENVEDPKRFVESMRRNVSICILSLLSIGIIIFVVFAPKLPDIKEFKNPFIIEETLDENKKLLCINISMKFDSDIPGIVAEAKGFSKIIAEEVFYGTPFDHSSNDMLRKNLNDKIKEKKNLMNEKGISVYNSSLRMNDYKEDYPLTQTCR